MTLLLPAIAALVLDLVSKIIVTRTLGPDSHRESVEIVPGLVELEYSRNTGVAFGFLSGGSAIVWLAIAAGLVLGTWLMISTLATASRTTLFAYGLIAGGAIGNIVNRVVSGHVIDFIEVGRWPAFNIADSMLTVGLLIVIVGQLRTQPGTMAEHRGG